jgi:hypothetical protein
MYIDTVPNRNSPPAVLLRESSRVGHKIIKRTLANLSDWPAPQVDRLRRVLKSKARLCSLPPKHYKSNAPCPTATWLPHWALCAASVLNPSCRAQLVPNAIWHAL